MGVCVCTCVCATIQYHRMSESSFRTKNFHEFHEVFQYSFVKHSTNYSVLQSSIHSLRYSGCNRGVHAGKPGRCLWTRDQQNTSVRCSEHTHEFRCSHCSNKEWLC